MLLLRQLAPVVASLPEPPVAVTTMPIVADLMGRLPVRRWVYYCVDDFGQWPGLDQEPLQRMEEEVVAKADRIVAVSETLQEQHRPPGPQVRPADARRRSRLLDESAAGDAMAELANLERPLIVFWGVIDRRMDLALRATSWPADLDRGTVAAGRPGRRPGSGTLPNPARRPPPALPFERLPALAREAAVLVMPYADLPVTRAMQPLKLKEYLATGQAGGGPRPAGRPRLGRLPRPVRTRRRRSPPRSGPAAGRAARRPAAGPRRLAAESWDEKARTFERLVLETLPDAVPCC